ncbi:hypothetical protein PROVRUST_04685 [Providencia rustigianii DSM 4541]|uniref:Uncharacterized protein n=1 Tax=Providencia rustigianii DSM 4541 TaxID=500637 RepID=D1NXQ2_9GAMM|nr:hypothetical protein PROVRUST_04685 [Providencia rustigianii DSM 4541]
MKVVSLTTNNDIVEKTTKKEHNALYTHKQPNTLLSVARFQRFM